ncbi:MAG: type II toxin-antitoxin system VapC family toxin [Chloroflexi bacterium]|nr:type II toxin-antitoxin system VapC family toxin [Chloroflexota bacterium]
MIFVDTNVLMYAVGAPHPLQGAAREFLDESTRLRTPLCTSAEVLQELSHAYLSAGRLPALEAAMTLVARAGVEVWPLEEADVTLAQQLHVQHAGLSARDLCHLASCRRRGVDRIMTFDRALAAAAPAGPPSE